MAFKRTTAINKIASLKNRIKVIQGGTSSGKTYAIIPLLIDIAIKVPRIKITVVAETLPAVKEGALDIFKNVMYDTNRWNDKNFHGSELIYTFSNKSRIQFKSFDSEGKAKASGKRDVLFLNEANHIPFKIADALMIRSRFTFIDFNPDNEFWVHTEVLTGDNADFLILDYTHNEAIPKETLEDILSKRKKAFYNYDLPKEELFKESNIKSSYWANWWKVYGLGEIGSLDGTIFNNWNIIDNLPPNAKLVGYGMDFGFSNDPTTLTAIYEYENKYVLDEVIYHKGLLNSELSRLMVQKEVSKSTPIYADCADPKSIKDLKQYGWNVKESIKGKDSIIYGIQKMQEYDFLVTSNSFNLIDELRKYAWDKDRNGNNLNNPVDFSNHAIDGIRYFFNTKDKKNGKYIV